MQAKNIAIMAWFIRNGNSLNTSLILLSGYMLQ